MPGKNFYNNLSPANQLRRFIDHHADRKTRHISKDEAKILEDIADQLEKDDNRNGSAQGSR